MQNTDGRYIAVFEAVKEKSRVSDLLVQERMVRRDLEVIDVPDNFFLKNACRRWFDKRSKLAGFHDFDELSRSDDIADPQVDEDVEERYIHLDELDVDGADLSFVAERLDYPFTQHVDVVSLDENGNHLRDDQRMLVAVLKDDLDPV